MEIAEGFYQMLNLNDVVRLFTFRFSLFTFIYAWRIEDTGKPGKDIIGCADATYLPLIQKSYTFTTTNLIEIRR